MKTSPGLITIAGVFILGGTFLAGRASVRSGSQISMTGANNEASFNTRNPLIAGEWLDNIRGYSVLLYPDGRGASKEFKGLRQKTFKWNTSPESINITDISGDSLPWPPLAGGYNYIYEASTVIVGAATFRVYGPTILESPTAVASPESEWGFERR